MRRGVRGPHRVRTFSTVQFTVCDGLGRCESSWARRFLPGGRGYRSCDDGLVSRAIVAISDCAHRLADRYRGTGVRCGPRDRRGAGQISKEAGGRIALTSNDWPGLHLAMDGCPAFRHSFHQCLAGLRLPPNFGHPNQEMIVSMTS